MRTKKHRLPEAAYFGEVVVSFTGCEARRRNMFADSRIVEVFVKELEVSLDKFACNAPVYCFMPDHLHVLINGLEFRSRPKGAMEYFKHQTGSWLKIHHPEFEWQDDFHDHIIRKSDDWRSHVQYIAANPVRAGFVEDMLAYPFTGSIGYELGDILVNSMF